MEFIWMDVQIIISRAVKFQRALLQQAQAEVPEFQEQREEMEIPAMQE